MTSINEMLENKEFLVDLVEVKNPEELRDLFLANSLTLEDGLTYERAFELVKAQENEELSEEALEEVSGGFLVTVGIVIVSAGILCVAAGYGYEACRYIKSGKWRG